MQKVKFVFGIHNHQPVGNFDFVFEEAYQKSYLPFIEVLERHPKIRISLHFTGILLDWIERHHPELLTKVRAMTERGQLEIMSGAYYEPILAVIPHKDRLGQIEKLSRRVKELFGYQPKGMWLAERIWEPDLPTTLAQAGIKYTVIDDTHFKYAGLTDEELDGYYLTENLGDVAAIFPISKHLRYTIPFQNPQETINHLREKSSPEGQTIVVFADDGEKFGVWPDTYRHVYENGWLENFFTAIEQNLDWIEMVHFSEALLQAAPVGKIYLPTASYAEMMHWSLFPKTFHLYEQFERLLEQRDLYEQYGIFVRGGFWRNFMTKYPEVNVMHKKMLRVSKKLWSLPAKDRKQLSAAFDHLWAAQCNCPYWHGVFGGIYLSHIRFAIFQNLIQAEKLLDAFYNREKTAVALQDFDVDGHAEVLIETPVHNAYFKPHSGATLFEYDFKPAEKNLLDTLTRREEGYHEKLRFAKVVGQESEPNDDGQAASIHDLVLAKEPNLMEYLNYDWYERKSFIDHFLGADATLDNFSKAKYREEGDFVNRPYALKKKQVNQQGAFLRFQRDGHLWREGGPVPITVRKELQVSGQSGLIKARYTISAESANPISLIFAVEFNFGLQAGHAQDRYYYDEAGRLKPDAFLDSAGILKDRRFLGLKDEYLRLNIRLHTDQTAEIWRMPVETISLSEAGFERVYQSSTVLFVWRLTLVGEWQVNLRHEVDLITP